MPRKPDTPATPRPPLDLDELGLAGTPEGYVVQEAVNRLLAEVTALRAELDATRATLAVTEQERRWYVDEIQRMRATQESEADHG